MLNEESRTVMMWAVRFEWPNGTGFELNCYCHWATLVISVGDRTIHFFFSKDRVTQRYPLVMVTYGLVIVLLICELYQTHPGVTYPWYADYAGAGSTFEGIRRNLDDLMVRGAPQRYFLEPIWIILDVSLWNVPRAEDLRWV